MTTKHSHGTTDIETLEAEVADLEQRLAAAASAFEVASSRLQTIDKDKDALAGGVFAGDPTAVAAFKELEEEEDEVLRTLRVSRVETENLRVKIAEVRDELRAAQIRVHKERYYEIQAEAKELRQRREEAADALLDVLAEEEKLHHRFQQKASDFDQELANSLALNPARRVIGNYLASKFSDYVGRRR